MHQVFQDIITWGLETLFWVLLALISYLWADLKLHTKRELTRLDEKIDEGFKRKLTLINKLDTRIEIMQKSFAADNLEHRDRLANVVDKMWREMKQYNIDHTRTQEVFFNRLTSLDEKYNQLAIAQAREYLTKHEVVDLFKQQIAPVLVKLDEIKGRRKGD